VVSPQDSFPDIVFGKLLNAGNGIGIKLPMLDRSTDRRFEAGNFTVDRSGADCLGKMNRGGLCESLPLVSFDLSGREFSQLGCLLKCESSFECCPRPVQTKPWHVLRANPNTIDKVLLWKLLLRGLSEYASLVSALSECLPIMGTTTSQLRVASLYCEHGHRRAETSKTWGSHSPYVCMPSSWTGCLLDQNPSRGACVKGIVIATS
jgi:hypothetical protein